MDKAKKRMPLISGLLLLVLYIFIFGFSEQDGETSGSISLSLSRYGVELWSRLNGRHFSELLLQSMADYFEHPLRKAAHFAEYALMGILVSCFLYTFIKSVKKRYILSVFWVFISAALDELHQYFVPGRWASFADVLLDTCGGAVGAALCCMFLYQTRKRKVKLE